ncbi:putative ATP-dependent RNA helicase DHX35 [Rhizoclosmatium globosum]|uniref:RNA helicase n=1 Tax=Rhizoclosmatium globosum TaxID=329046 RepID=A0A1Y2BYZ7_9FUNG|nr:putative ATP-dependent RNA helicase DHX35 [Rhizoclosmatium globosum]|eukprot:ORY39867.1 putative ATP-dependent RNA helicase DHX35 [Rhizoclosmatium globosum]
MLRKRLPIFASRNQLLFLVENFQTAVVVGATGSGKTTQLPQYLFEEKWGTQGIIACSQPRRIAVTSVAARVAEEMKVPLGREVGYAVRFDDVSSDATKIKFMTDGILFREALLDPLLSKYSVVMIDEAHERSLYTDIMLGILKKIMKKRAELRVIISSATLDAQVFKEFFNFNPTPSDTSKDTSIIVSIEGRTFPVDIQFLKTPCSDYVNEAVEVALQIHKHESEGDILIFMTGKEEVDVVVSTLNDLAKRFLSSDLFSNNTHNLEPSTKTSARSLRAVPIYGGLTIEEQSQAFDAMPDGIRKVVVSTNIAEASVTIDGIVYVIDCGLVKIKAYNPTTAMESLIVVPLSKAAALQRAGRAGRTRPGKCFRLYTEKSYGEFRDNSIPEMQRSNLVSVILQLKAMGIDNVLRFDFLSPPSAESMAKALELLYSLKALDDYGRLTMPFGLQLAEFPVDPSLGAMLLNSHGFKCAEETLSIAAVLTVQNVFISPSNARLDAEEERRKFCVEEGDHITYLNVYNAFIKNKQSQQWCQRRFVNYKALLRAVAIRKQLEKYMKKFEVDIRSCRGDTVAVRKAIVSGYFAQAAKLQPDGSYVTLRERTVCYIHPTSVLFNRSPGYVVFNEVLQTDRTWIRDVSVIDDPKWLTEVASHFYEFKK